MKKSIICLLLAALLLLVACGKQEEAPELSFRGIIIERTKTSVTVEVAEDEDERSSSDLISFSVADLARIGAEVGDTVKVIYTGVIMESYPAQVVATGWSISEKAPESEPEEPAEATEPQTLETDNEEHPVLSIEPEIPTLGDTPPALVITASNQEYRIGSGNYSWEWPNPDGTMSSVIACGIHPLDYTGEADMVQYAEGETLFFRFDVMPQSVTCRCWTEEYWGDPQSYEANYEVLELGEYTLMPLSNVRYVYELTADWGDGRSASYIFGSICDAVPSTE